MALKTRTFVAALIGALTVLALIMTIASVLALLTSSMTITSHGIVPTV